LIINKKKEVEEIIERGRNELDNYPKELHEELLKNSIYFLIRISIQTRVFNGTEESGLNNPD